MARKSPPSSWLNKSRGIPKGPSVAGCLHVYMLTCLQALGLTPMLARHLGRDSVLHCGGSDWAPADASPHPDGGTLNPAVAGFQRESAVVFAAPVVVCLGRVGPRALWLGLVVCLCGVPLVWGPCWGALVLWCPPGVGWCAFGCWPQLVGHPGCGRGGSTCWGAPLVWCTAGRRVTHPLVGDLMVCLGLRPAVALVPSCAGASAWCPTTGVLHTGGPHGLPQ